MKLLIYSIIVSFCLCLMASCQIDPPLYLPDKDKISIKVELPINITDINVLWNVEYETYFDSLWYYGWDEKDEKIFGKIEYPEPTTFDIVNYYKGYSNKIQNIEKFMVSSRIFKRQYQYGVYDMQFWSEPVTDDPTEQTIKVNEANYQYVTATTPYERLQDGYRLYLQPEIIYSGSIADEYISPYIEDYDYYDPVEHVYVKKFKTELYPLVYTYLIQLILKNNHNKVSGVTGSAYMSGLGNTTSVMDGNVEHGDNAVIFTTRFKDSVDYKGEKCSAVGSKLLTFGKAGLEDVYGRKNVTTRAGYSGEHDKVDNKMGVGLRFVNNTDSVYYFNVTEQVNRQLSGGIITVLIDCDTLKMPTDTTRHQGGIFEPYVQDYDSIIYYFEM